MPTPPKFLRACCTFLAVFWLVLWASTSTAHAAGFSCSGGQATGDLYKVDRECKITINTFITGTLCQYQKTLSQVVGQMFCKMQDALLDPLTKLITLYIIFFAVRFTTGISPFKASDAIIHLLKVALVLGFASSADLTIGIVYKFFMAILEEGTALVLSIWDGHSTDVYSQYESLDKSFAQSSLAKFASGESKLSTFVLVVMLVVPPLFYIIMSYIIKAIKVFARAIIGFALAITGIAFLMSVFTLFLGLALFKPTYPFFEKCIHYLVSFALQVVIVFAFIAMMHTLDLESFTKAINEVIVMYEVKWELGPIKMPGFSLPTVCEMTIDANGIPKCNQPIVPIPFSGLMQQIDFLKFTLIKLMGLIVVVHAFEAFQTTAPKLAQQLASSKYGPRLGGLSPAKVSLEETKIPLFGADALEEFQNGFSAGFKQAGGNPIARVWAGMQQGTERMSTVAKGDASSFGDIDVSDPINFSGSKQDYATWMHYRRQQ